MIISFIQTKGGTGKTTLAKCLAYSTTFKKKFSSISLIELDPQGTIESWHLQRSDNNFSDNNVNFITLANSNETKIEEILLECGNKEGGIIILDVPGESIGKFRTKFAISLSDLIFIPMRSSTNDEQSFFDNIHPLIEENIRNDTDEAKSFFVLPTFVHPQASVKNVQNYFNNAIPDINCLDIVFPQRSIYENFSRNGYTLHDYAKKIKTNKKYYKQAKKAIKDIEQIAKKIIFL